MKRLLLLLAMSLVANFASANKPAEPVAPSAANETACPAEQRAHVVKINANSDGSYAYSAVVRLDKSGQQVVVNSSNPPKLGWFICGPAGSH